MGLGQRTDHWLSGGGAHFRRGGRLALQAAPLAGPRPVPAEDPDGQRRQCDDGHRGGWLLWLHPLERLVPHGRMAILGPPGWPGAHGRPARGGGGCRAGEPPGPAHRPSPRSGRWGPALGRGGDVVRRTSRDDARLRGPMATGYGAARDRRGHAVSGPQRHRGRLGTGREPRDSDRDEFCRAPGRSCARRRGCRGDHRDADAGDGRRGVSLCQEVQRVCCPTPDLAACLSGTSRLARSRCQAMVPEAMLHGRSSRRASPRRPCTRLVRVRGA